MMKKLTLFSMAIVCLIFSHCSKEVHVKEDQNYHIYVEEARTFFDKELASTDKLTRRHQLMHSPDWSQAVKKNEGGREVLVIPILFEKDLTVKLDNGNVSLSVQGLTKLFFYRDDDDKAVAEVVTTIPDGLALNNKDPDRQFTGMVWIETWAGQSIRNDRYTTGGNITSFELGSEVQADLQAKMKDLDIEWCYIDYFYCADASGFVTCSYNFSQAYSCGLGGGNIGGLTPGLYPVYGGGGGNWGGGPSAPPGDATVGVGLNTTILAPPENPVTDPYQYKRCFNRDNRNSYRIILYVDQPKPGARALMSDREGNTTLASINNDTKTYGHTWIAFEEIRPGGNVIRRSLGFWPRQDINLSTQAAPGILGDDGGRDFDVSLEIGLVRDAFLNLLDDCSMGNLERYNLNINNCTGWAIDKIYNNTAIALPKTLASWAFGFGEGPSPGNLGEDIRLMDLSIIANNSKVTDVKRTTSPAPSLRNYGNCPILPAP